MGHIDVVNVVRKKWHTDPFLPTVKDGKLFGRGSSDMKAGVSVIIELFKKCLKTKPNKNVSFVFTTGEEL